MIVDIFISSQLNLSQLANSIFSILGADNKDILIGQSSYSINDTYYWVSFAGVRFKIDENNYDFEDEFNYHLNIKKDVRKKINIDEEIILASAKIISRLILNNLKVDKLAIENENGDLQLLNP